MTIQHKMKIVTSHITKTKNKHGQTNVIIRQVKEEEEADQGKHEEKKYIKRTATDKINMEKLRN